MSDRRFYVFTGKGGVGKTTLAFAFAKHLQQNGSRVKLINFEESLSPDLVSHFSLTTQTLELQSSAEGYVTKKLKSATLARWVTKKKFFQALLNMIPGFSYVIYLGHILEQLHDDPNLIIVLDSPSSGHALTMFESVQNFREIFKVGALVADMNKMVDFVRGEKLLKTIICGLPMTMALNEAMELQDSLKKLELGDNQIYINNCLPLVEGIESADKPLFLQQKIDLEKDVLEKFSPHIMGQLKHVATDSATTVIEELVPHAGVFAT